MHPDFHAIARKCAELRIRVGVTTNGTRLSQLPPSVAWCRISMSSRRRLTDIAGSLLHISQCPNTTWSFNYILHGCVNDLRDVVQFANQHDFVQVRIVPDILNLSDFSANKAEAQALLEGIDDKVIYQTWPQFSGGARKCWVGLLKPTLAADGRWMPCCAVEFPERGERRELDWPRSVSLASVIEQQEYFDGSKCAICYYDNYNRLLQSLLDEVDHKEWL